MILLAVAIIAIVQTLMSPMKSERAMLKGIRRFFRGCARVTGRYDFVAPVALDAAGQARGRRYRKRYFESMILPAPAKLQAVQKYLDYRRYPDNPSEKVQRLIDALQSIANRLQSLEIAHNHLAGECQEHPDSWTQVGACLRELQELFDRWAGIEGGAEVLGQHEELERLSDELEQSFDILQSDPSVTSDQVPTDIYAFLGCLRGLIEAMGNAHVALSQINWPQWAAPRF